MLIKLDDSTKKAEIVDRDIFGWTIEILTKSQNFPNLFISNWLYLEFSKIVILLTLILRQVKFSKNSLILVNLVKKDEVVSESATSKAIQILFKSQNPQKLLKTRLLE